MGPIVNLPLVKWQPEVYPLKPQHLLPLIADTSHDRLSILMEEVEDALALPDGQMVYRGAACASQIQVTVFPNRLHLMLDVRPQSSIGLLLSVVSQFHPATESDTVSVNDSLKPALRSSGRGDRDSLWLGPGEGSMTCQQSAAVPSRESQ